MPHRSTFFVDTIGIRIRGTNYERMVMCGVLRFWPWNLNLDGTIFNGKGVPQSKLCWIEFSSKLNTAQ